MPWPRWTTPPPAYAHESENLRPLDFPRASLSDHDAAHADRVIRTFRTEAQRVQAQDGGVLTPEHRSTLQARYVQLLIHLRVQPVQG